MLKFGKSVFHKINWKMILPKVCLACRNHSWIIDQFCLLFPELETWQKKFGNNDETWQTKFGNNDDKYKTMPMLCCSRSWNHESWNHELFFGTAEWAGFHPIKRNKLKSAWKIMILTYKIDLSLNRNVWHNITNLFEIIFTSKHCVPTYLPTLWA